MKGLSNLLQWADLLNGCHNSFPAHMHTHVQDIFVEAVTSDSSREQFSCSGLCHDENIKHFYENHLAAVGDLSVLVVGSSAL